MGNFQPLEVVCRGRDTQLLVGENANYLFCALNKHCMVFAKNIIEQNHMHPL